MLDALDCPCQNEKINILDALDCLCGTGKLIQLVLEPLKIKIEVVPDTKTLIAVILLKLLIN